MMQAGQRCERGERKKERKKGRNKVKEGGENDNETKDGS